MNAIVCPISTEKIDSNVSRLTIFFNVVLLAFYVLTLNPVFLFIVAIDYMIRAVSKMTYSPMRLFALVIIRSLKLKKKPINMAQKIFASRLGMICAVAALALYSMGYSTASIVVASVLMVLAFMDSVFNFCLGCVIYNYLVYPFYKDK